MTTTKAPPAAATPSGLGPAGKALWRSLTGTDGFEFEPYEAALLLQACRASDYCDRLADEAARGAVTVENHRGDMVASPAMVESRQQALTLSRLLAALRLPSGEEEGEVRPQRRGGARPPYGMRVVR